MEPHETTQYSNMPWKCLISFPVLWRFLFYPLYPIIYWRFKVFVSVLLPLEFFQISQQTFHKITKSLKTKITKKLFFIRNRTALGDVLVFKQRSRTILPPLLREHQQLRSNSSNLPSRHFYSIAWKLATSSVFTYTELFHLDNLSTTSPQTL